MTAFADRLRTLRSLQLYKRPFQPTGRPHDFSLNRLKANEPRQGVVPGRYIPLPTPTGANPFSDFFSTLSDSPTPETKFRRHNPMGAAGNPKPADWSPGLLFLEPLSFAGPSGGARIPSEILSGNGLSSQQDARDLKSPHLEPP